MIKEGRGANGDLFEIIVNEEFEKLLGGNVLNKIVSINNISPISFQTGNKEKPYIKDSLNFDEKFKIVGIIKEFPFLNTPKIYYSYYGAKLFLKKERMENLSLYFGKFYSYYDYLQDCKNDDPVSSYSNCIFVTDPDELDLFLETISSLNNKNLSVTSSALEIKETYTTFINSFSSTLIVFVIIAFVGINFILGMISLSTFIESRKNTAIMTCLGAKNSSIYNLYLTENYILIFLAFGFSILLAKFLETILNQYLFKSFSLSNLITIPFESFCGVKFGFIFLLLGIAIIFSTVFTLTPMIIYRTKSLADELRDE